MEWPIVSVKTKDNLLLHGIFLEAKNSKTVLINIHGSASNFYEEDFARNISKHLMERGVSDLWTNNRGSSVLQAYPPSGAAMEKFEDCVLDIDAWIKFALSRGYNKIVLQGHSFGAEKIVYYMNNGKHTKKVVAIILLEFADSYGSQMRYTGGENKLMSEARTLIKKGKGNTFLTSDGLSCCGELPFSANTYVNFFRKNSELSKTLPLRNGKDLRMFRKISVPILAAIGDQKDYTIIPIRKALDLMKSENPRAECHQLKNCNHDFEGKEEELAKIIGSFIEKNLKIHN